jgi:hypothetical protein
MFCIDDFVHVLHFARQNLYLTNIVSFQYNFQLILSFSIATNKCLRSCSFLGWNEAKCNIIETYTGILYQHRLMMNDDEFGAIGGMIDKGNRSTCIKPAPVLL